MLRFIHGLQEVDVREWCEDWISIADDEARHFSMLDGRLHELGYEYGCLPAHDMIWQSAKVSEASRRTRLALGQLVAEARGLDAGPKLAARLTGLGDIVSAKIVSQIAVEEVRHVEIGVKWFVRECEKEGEDAVHAFHEIAMKYANPSAFAGPFERERRREAGMTEEWYEPVAEMMMKERERRRRERNANADVAEGIKA